MGDAKVGDRLDVFMETSVWLIKTGCVASESSLYYVDHLEREKQ